MRLILILTIFTLGCASTSKSISASKGNEDVLILSTLLQEHLKKTDGRSANLDELTFKDSSSRIIKNFEAIEIVPEGRYMVVYYRFSKFRNSKSLILNDKEKSLMSKLKWKKKKLKSEYDGEIRFDYPEKFYHLKGIFLYNQA
jgi:hypothetical protein